MKKGLFLLLLFLLLPRNIYAGEEDRGSSELIERIYNKSGIVVVNGTENCAWQHSELEILDNLLDTLPGEYKRLAAIYLKRGRRRSHIKKRIIYLPGPGLEEQALKQHLVRELTRFLDRAGGISESWQWRKISRWTGWDIAGNRAENKNIKGFAAPGGRKSPEEDLVTTAGMFFTSPEYSGSQKYLKCRLPAKYDFMKNLFLSKPDPQACVTCKQTYKDWIDPDNVEQIELLIASPSFASIASVAGHILLLIRQKDDIGGLSTTVGFVATPVNKKGQRDSGFIYMFRGIFGYYLSKLQVETLAGVLQRYTLREDRDIYRLKLKLSKKQIRDVICRLWEIDRNFTYKYYFFNKNCTTMFVNLINYVLPEDQRLKDRDFIDLPLNVGSDLFLKGIAEFVYPEYWSISKQARYAVKQNRRLKEKILAYFNTNFPGQTAVRMEQYFDDSFSARESTRMAALRKLFSLYSDTSGALSFAGNREQFEKEYYSHGKLLLKYLMNARTREKYIKILEGKRRQKESAVKDLLNDETKVFPLVDIILKLRCLLGRHINDEVTPLYDEIEEEFTGHVLRSRERRTFDCGYSPIFILPRLTCYRDNFIMQNTFRISTLSQQMGDNSVFSLGCDTHLEFLNFDLSFNKVFDRKTGTAARGKTFTEMGFKLLEYEKILVRRRADYNGWFNYGFGFSLFNSTKDRWRHIKRDTGLIDLRFLFNIFEKEDFKHFLTAALTCGYSHRVDMDGSSSRFMDVAFRLTGKFHLFGSSRNALRFNACYKPRFTFSTDFISEFRTGVEIDWSQGAYANSLFTTGFSY
ncbi:MAG: DUF4105 domain-containing protein, partial [Candidatus Aminicenantes bacterium]|nr:DUF4105 domain-containing protein [Candidatus Aminicenantes bacterium]